MQAILDEFKAKLEVILQDFREKQSPKIGSKITVPAKLAKVEVQKNGQGRDRTPHQAKAKWIGPNDTPQGQLMGDLFNAIQGLLVGLFNNVQQLFQSMGNIGQFNINMANTWTQFFMAWGDAWQQFWQNLQGFIQQFMQNGPFL